MKVYTHTHARNVIRDLVAYERSSRINGSGIPIRRNCLALTRKDSKLWWLLKSTVGKELCLYIMSAHITKKEWKDVYALGNFLLLSILVI